ncbi:MAG: DUF3800 domain-containing protein [Bryobacterales bacterium]|nr:DUF3800 domain-containing protein [Bryobacterales bacterium]
MSQSYNIYCDESCHLENDHLGVMVLGALWCPVERVREVMKRIKEIKARHGLAALTEVKWVKISPAKTRLYLDLIDYFFDDDDLHFRALVVPDKSKLNHTAFQQDHDDWYYKMYFDMIKVLLGPRDDYRIFLDIKDTRSAVKVAKLQQVLCNNMYDFKREILKQIQSVRSHEVQILQLCDVLLGAIAYANRDLHSSPAKQTLVERIRERSGYQLDRTTLFGERKFNIFVWRASEAEA